MTLRILWVVNVPLPEASVLMNEKPSPFGGWLIHASQMLAAQDGIRLSVAFPGNNMSGYQKIEGQNINYYCFAPVKDSEKKRIENDGILTNIVREVSPDLVHIYGTEMAHSLSMVNVCVHENIKTIISIQGLVSVYERHVFADLPLRAIFGATLRNLLKRDNVIGLKRLYAKRGKNEIEAIRNTEEVIGRTTWDKACVSQINPNVRYHFCNETLREEFYKHQWDINKCEEYSIFVSQSQNPIKGLHYVLEAMPLILAKFPDAKLYVAGKDITKQDTLTDKLRITYYGRYINQLIRKLKLEDQVVFTGLLSEEKMCERYLKSNVFVSASSIENSPNSLGEAMILGVPCVASHVGGVPDMLKHGEEGFVYQADAPYMIAYYVCELFEHRELALSFSRKARKRALRTHDPDGNAKQLVDIYKRILDRENRD